MRNQSQPKVSVLIPLYHTNANHLREAIESILEQSFENFELLILNDSPENESLERIINSYEDKRIKYYKNERNIGITHSRNKLVSMAKGEYLAIMDHDDISLPDRFKKQVEYLDANPDVGVVGCYAESFPRKGHYPSRFENDEEIKLALMSKCAIIHPSSMIRASILIENEICYEEEFSPSEDYALWARLIPITNFYNIPEVLFLYRWHFNNTTKKNLAQMRLATTSIREQIRIDNPELYADFLSKAQRILRIRLFGYIPLFKIVRDTNFARIYLFDLILILKIKFTIKMN